MKIINIEPLVLRIPDWNEECMWGYDAFLVKITTDEGIVGIGSSDTNPYVAKGIIEAPNSNFFSCGMKELLLGENPLEIQKLWNKMYFYSTYYGRRSAAVHVISAIDIALWDIASQYYQVPIHTLLGGKQHNKIKVYASLEEKEESVQEEVNRAKACQAEGYHCIKVAVGAKELEEDYHRLCALREALGQEMNIAVDACSRWRDTGTALRSIHRLKEAELYFIEEPVVSDLKDGYRKIAEMTGINMAGGENLTTRYEFLDFMEQAQPTIVQPDITRCGGISELRRIQDLADLKGCQIIPHDWSTPILVSAAVQFLSAQEAPPQLEYCLSESPIYQKLFKNRLKAEKGYITVPDCIGLGLTLDEEFVKEYRRDTIPGMN